MERNRLKLFEAVHAFLDEAKPPERFEKVGAPSATMRLGSRKSRSLPSSRHSPTIRALNLGGFNDVHLLHAFSARFDAGDGALGSMFARRVWPTTPTAAGLFGDAFQFCGAEIPTSIGHGLHDSQQIRLSPGCRAFFRRIPNPARPRLCPSASRSASSPLRRAKPVSAKKPRKPAQPADT